MQEGRRAETEKAIESPRESYKRTAAPLQTRKQEEWDATARQRVRQEMVVAAE